MKEKEYIKELEQFISKLLEPIRNLPFSILIESLYGYKVLPFDINNVVESSYLPKLTNACMLACKNAYEEGIQARRINEVGNYIESYVKDALITFGFKAETPIAKNGSHKTAGYPDVYFETEDGVPFYLECKTYNANNIDSTFRTFYVSPSKNPKITKDAYHLMIAFEIAKEKREKEDLFVPTHWKLYSLESLIGQIKHEFNASNKDLYTMDTLLAEGNTSKLNNKKSTIDEFF